LAIIETLGKMVSCLSGIFTVWKMDRSVFIWTWST